MVWSRRPLYPTRQVLWLLHRECQGEGVTSRPGLCTPFSCVPSDVSGGGLVSAPYPFVGLNNISTRSPVENERLCNPKEVGMHHTPKTGPHAKAGSSSMASGVTPR